MYNLSAFYLSITIIPFFLIVLALFLHSKQKRELYRLVLFPMMIIFMCGAVQSYKIGFAFISLEIIIKAVEYVRNRKTNPTLGSWHYVLFLIFFYPSFIFSQCPDILPSSDFSTNFCNFPFAWEISLGENTSVSIITENEKDHSWQAKEIQRLARNSEINFFPLREFLNLKYIGQRNQIVYVVDQVKPEDYDSMIKAMENDKNITIVMPAFFGPMDDTKDYSGWIKFVNKASNHGAIIVGAHGDMYQLGDLSFWKRVPIDVFAVLGRKINGFQAMKPDYKIKANLDESSYLMAATVALLKSKYPDLSNNEIKKILTEKGRKVYWSLIEIPEGKEGTLLAMPHFDADYLGKYENMQIRKIEKNVYSACSLDLSILFDFNCPSHGGWCLKTLHTDEAQKMATGKNVTVAILDHGFDKKNEALQNRLVLPHSCIQGIPALADVPDHGTEMAECLVHVAPDVKIMPVVIFGNGHWGDAEKYIEGIHYAVDHGADIISLSHRAIEEENQKNLDEAVQYATQHGVTFVYIHYSGDRDEVIIPSPVEFEKYNSDPKIIYVIGTNFLSKESPITWGVSQTAPIVSGVISLMKEKQPNLKPMKIKEILLISGRETLEGIRILDAEKAMKNLTN